MERAGPQHLSVESFKMSHERGNFKGEKAPDANPTVFQSIQRAFGQALMVNEQKIM